MVEASICITCAVLGAVVGFFLSAACFACAKWNPPEVVVCCDLCGQYFKPQPGGCTVLQFSQVSSLKVVGGTDLPYNAA